MDAYLKKLIEEALSEDLGNGDVTSEAIVPADAASTADIKAKQDLVLAGLEVVREVFHYLDPATMFESLARDGDRIRTGAVVARVSGKTRILLAGERAALNLLQHLSGIATLTSRYVEQLKGTKAQILDTRKTLPGLEGGEGQGASLVHLGAGFRIDCDHMLDVQ